MTWEVIWDNILYILRVYPWQSVLIVAVGYLCAIATAIFWEMPEK